MLILETSMTVLGLYLTFYVFHTLFLVASNLLLKERERAVESPRTRFQVIIPAHNEEIYLPRLLRSLASQQYPPELFHVLVVADNCSDGTVQAASHYPVHILERKNDSEIGKGYAIRFALDNTDTGAYDAFFIVDADSVLAEDALAQLDRAVARGQNFVQCYNGVANPDESWFTRLLDVSRTLANEIFEPAKEKLGLSSHLMGNGMCFGRDVVSRYGWRAFSVGEDWEYYAKVILEGGRVAFARDARVYHQESSSLRQATPQRMRWSSGRFEIIRKYGFHLLFHGLKGRDIKKVDASFPLMLPNPSLAMNLSGMGFILSWMLSGMPHPFFALWFLGLIVAQWAVFLVGVMHTRNRWNNFLSLFAAPVFLSWKMGIDALSALGMGRKKWTRTERKLCKN